MMWPNVRIVSSRRFGTNGHIIRIGADEYEEVLVKQYFYNTFLHGVHLGMNGFFPRENENSWGRMTFRGNTRPERENYANPP